MNHKEHKHHSHDTEDREHKEKLCHDCIDNEAQNENDIVKTDNETDSDLVSKSETKQNIFLPISILMAAIIVGGSLIYINGPADKSDSSSIGSKLEVSELEEKVLPSKGVTLDVKWGDLGIKLVEAGVIDEVKFKAIYEQRGQLTEDNLKLLEGINNGKIKITSENSGYLLNLFWALGLANKNEILEKGEMMDPKYGGAGNFASTGGWTLAKGSPMDHYSMHNFFNLTSEQQAMVDKVSRGIYRPCCGNSVHFPDCNHGMAMLGLLELMASQGASEQDMWNTALTVNSYWFPDTYITIATYMQSKGIDWKDVNPIEVLGVNYSSGQGFANISAQVTQPAQSQQGGGSGCDVGGAPAPQAQSQQVGCGV
ncbi:MAG: hypothetical protein JJE53_01375 [Candidatus Pacebacteria bacterium]|nr:hypothetical protein [Candidatus Paceibacterota bacterium]